MIDARRGVLAALAASAVVLMAAAWARPPEYDEAYSIFLTAGHPRPAWPGGVFTAGSVRWLYRGTAGFGRIAQDLRHGDVHPPLYFWALEVWRRLLGPSWLAARLLSVACSVTALGLLARLAALAAVPVAPAVLIAGLSYGFAYTGSVARGFALAQLLDVLGAVLALAPRPGQAFTGGLAFGAASFTNYLASFTGAAFILWLLAKRDATRSALAALGFALFLPADLWFFTAQHGTRAKQFAAFHLGPALAQLARDAGAALATPAGLLALGLIFDNTPIEIRYLAFALPWVALLLAPLPRPALLLLLGVEACGVAGLCVAPLTMQPQGLAARAAARLTPGALVLLPRGNDGVGIPGPFVAAAPDGMRILLIRPDVLPQLGAQVPLAVAQIRADAASRATVPALDAMLDKVACLKRNTFGIITIYAPACGRLHSAHQEKAP